VSEEGQSKTLLLAFINRVKRLADEIGDLQVDITDVCKEAKGAGFEPTKIREVVAWLRKIDKHGRDKVDSAEEIFDLYRKVADGDAASFDELMDSERDRRLLAIFAPNDQVAAKLNRRTQSARAAVAMAKAAKQARSA
jgi:uncharacterized protein (UPF0335 family)